MRYIVSILFICILFMIQGCTDDSLVGPDENLEPPGPSVTITSIPKGTDVLGDIMILAIIRNVPDLMRSGIEIDGELTEFIGGADTAVQYNWVTESIEKGSTHRFQIIAQDSSYTRYPSDTLSLTVINGTFRVPEDIGTIQGAIDQAGHGDTILVSRGIYTENLDFKRKRLVISSEYLFTGDSLDIIQTIIDGNASDPVVKISGSVDERALLAGFTIQNGNSSYGGGIQCFNETKLRLHDLRIINNSAAYGAGIYLERNADVEIKRAYIANNTAQSKGGGLICFISKPHISDSIIEQNIAGSYGGGLYFEQSEGYELSNLQILQNQGSSGGGVYSWGCSGTMSDINYVENSSQFYGAALYSYYDSLQLSGIDCRLNTSEAEYGEAFYFRYSTIDLDEFSIEGNLCQGISSTYSKVSIANGSIIGNNGHGVSAHVSENIIQNVNITENMGSGVSLGGDAISTYASSAEIYDSKLSGNTAEYGGGIRTWSGGVDLVLNGVTIDSNIALVDGGGIYLQFMPYSGIEFKQLDIHHNLAGNQGGGIHIGNSPLSSPTVIFENNLIYENIAEARGGGLHLQRSGNFNIRNSTFSGNEAPEGSAISSFPSTGIILENSIVYAGSLPSIYVVDDMWSKDTVSVNYSMVEGGESSVSLMEDAVVLWGTGNLDSNPLFVDESSGDFHLSSNSPCVDAGDPISFSNDSDGTRNDMGAFGGPGGNW
ncbi:MAG: hypothetical protein ISR95_04860 [Candidatus Marinimicrobia bacterium]|nr:hypothetical protein [Candidatus Neomarinimicrobiota bacterium]